MENNSNFNYYTYTDTNGNKCVKAVVTDILGKSIWGIATCLPEDTYDEAFGKELARKKCVAKIVKKRYDECVTYTNNFQRYAVEDTAMARKYGKRAADTLACYQNILEEIKDMQKAR